MFLNPVRFANTGRFENGRRVYRLTAPLAFGVDPFLSVIVHEGFETDLASVPWIGRLLFLPDGPHAPAAILHDWLYVRRPFCRPLADAIFHQALIALGVTPWRAFVLHAAVRIGGWRAWRRQR